MAVLSRRIRKARKLLAELYRIYFIYRPREWLGYQLRRMGLTRSQKYQKLKQLADIHKDERCFVVCTGPSLTMDDLGKIENEICFSVNSIVMLFEKTRWRPMYYVFTPRKEVKAQVEEAVKKGELRTIFYTDVSNSRHQIENNYTLDQAIVYDCPVINDFKIHGRKVLCRKEWMDIRARDFKFNDNLYAGVSGGASIANIALQIAVYMGFREIYLLGCDCDFLGPKRHYPGLDYGSAKELAYERAAIGTNKMIVGYKKAKKYADKHGIKIYNATRGGALEVFERVDLDEVLGREVHYDQYN